MAIKKTKAESSGPGPKVKFKLFGKPYKNPKTGAEMKANDMNADKRAGIIGGVVTTGTLLGTGIALARTPGGQKVVKKVKEGVVRGAKKVGGAIKNIGKGREFVSNPDTGKMERVRQPKKVKIKDLPYTKNEKKSAKEMRKNAYKIK
jgi:hypothetical protein